MSARLAIATLALTLAASCNTSGKDPLSLRPRKLELSPASAAPSPSGSSDARRIQYGVRADLPWPRATDCGSGKLASGKPWLVQVDNYVMATALEPALRRLLTARDFVPSTLSSHALVTFEVDEVSVSLSSKESTLGKLAGTVGVSMECNVRLHLSVRPSTRPEPVVRFAGSGASRKTQDVAAINVESGALAPELEVVVGRLLEACLADALAEALSDEAAFRKAMTSAFERSQLD